MVCHGTNPVPHESHKGSSFMIGDILANEIRHYETSGRVDILMKALVQLVCHNLMMSMILIGSVRGDMRC
jgi:hypothetical protein